MEITRAANSANESLSGGSSLSGGNFTSLGSKSLSFSDIISNLSNTNIHEKTTLKQLLVGNVGHFEGMSSVDSEHDKLLLTNQLHELSLDGETLTVEQLQLLQNYINKTDLSGALTSFNSVNIIEQGSSDLPDKVSLKNFSEQTLADNVTLSLNELITKFLDENSKIRAEKDGENPVSLSILQHTEFDDLKENINLRYSDAEIKKFAPLIVDFEVLDAPEDTKVNFAFSNLDIINKDDSKDAHLVKIFGRSLPMTIDGVEYSHNDRKVIKMALDVGPDLLNVSIEESNGKEWKSLIEDQPLDSLVKNDKLFAVVDKSDMSTFIVDVNLSDIGNPRTVISDIQFEFKGSNNNEAYSKGFPVQFLLRDTSQSSPQAATGLSSSNNMSALLVLGDEANKYAKILNPENIQNSVENWKQALNDNNVDRIKGLLKDIKTIRSSELKSQLLLESFGSLTRSERLGESIRQNYPSDLKDIISAIPQGGRSKLYLTTTDILNYRNVRNGGENKVLSNNLSNNYNFGDLIGSEDEVVDTDTLRFDSNLLKTRSNMVIPKLNETILKSSTTENSPILGSTIGNSIFSNNQSVPNNFGVPQAVNILSLFEPQFEAKLGAILAAQAIEGKENFEIQLEPESFGKVRVNVNIDKSFVDVKMTVENSAALSVLKSSETVLQNITEQNGLRLSDYSVDYKSGNNENYGSNSDKENKQNRFTQDNLKSENEEDQNFSNDLGSSRVVNLLA